MLGVSLSTGPLLACFSLHGSTIVPPGCDRHLISSTTILERGGKKVSARRTHVEKKIRTTCIISHVVDHAAGDPLHHLHTITDLPGEGLGHLCYIRIDVSRQRLRYFQILVDSFRQGLGRFNVITDIADNIGDMVCDSQGPGRRD